MHATARTTGHRHHPDTTFSISYEDGAFGLAYYRRQAPWESLTPSTLRGEVRETVEGGFFLFDAGDRVTYVAWPSEVYRHLRPGNAVLVRGTTYGVTLTATAVTHADGSPIAPRPGRP